MALDSFGLGLRVEGLGLKVCVQFLMWGFGVGFEAASSTRVAEAEDILPKEILVLSCWSLASIGKTSRNH